MQDIPHAASLKTSHNEFMRMKLAEKDDSSFGGSIICQKSHTLHSNARRISCFIISCVSHSTSTLRETLEMTSDHMKYHSVGHDAPCN